MDDLRNLSLTNVDLARKNIEASDVSPELKESLRQSVDKAEEVLKARRSEELGLQFLKREEFDKALPLMRVGWEDPTLTKQDLQRMVYKPMEVFLGRVEKRVYELLPT